VIRAGALLLLAACATAPRAPAAAPPASTPLADLVERAQPSVVLLLAYRADGKVGFGSGLLVDDRGLVLTNLHVIAEGQSLGALLYRKDRVSYTPMDGGLGRYLFEHQKEIVSARLVRADASTDLAVVQLDAATPHEHLPLRDEPLRVGERVLALGHPQETVWSFTSGVVSALHHGAIQHDAVVSNGSSGGPLLDERGRVVGINTARVISEARGMAFARPIALARGLIDVAQRPAAVDLSTPERAVTSCWHAIELAAPDMIACMDWKPLWLVFRAALDEAERLGASSSEIARLEQAIAAAGGADGWIDRLQKLMIAAYRRQPPPVFVAPGGAPAWTPHPEISAAADGRSSEAMARWHTRLREQNHFTVHMHDMDDVQKWTHMGARVDGVRTPRPDLAWVLVTGRNFDGSEHHYASCLVRVGHRWLGHEPVTPDELRTLPDGWPPPLLDGEVMRLRYVAALLQQLAK
jgi:hypothetical protein